jgi:hypothetical protein
MESLPHRALLQYISGGFFGLQRIAFTSGHAGLDEARPADVPVDRISAFVMAVTDSRQETGVAPDIIAPHNPPVFPLDYLSREICH